MTKDSLRPADLETILRHPTAYKKDNVFSTLDTLRSLVVNPEIKIVSFDCFDTLVKRASHQPNDIFDRIAEELLSKGLLPPYVDVKRFRDWRVRAEERARKRTAEFGVHEVTLTQIYDELPTLTGTAVNALDFVRAELTVERQNIFLNEDVIEVARLARRVSKKVIVVSDTYFSQNELKYVTRLDAEEIFAEYYVSSEYKTGKGGSLFDIIVSNEGVSPHEIIHIGDNYEADISCSDTRGIQNFYVPNGASSFWAILEEELRQPTLERRYWSAAGIGYWHSRLTPLRSLRVLHDANGAESGHYAFGYEVLGPIFFGYLKWVESVVDGLQSPVVIGLLREGGFLAGLFRLIKPDADIFGLALSRRTVSQLMLKSVTKETLSNLISARRGEQLSDFAKKIGLSETDFPTFMRSQIVDVGASGSEVIDYIVTTDALRGKVIDFAASVWKEFLTYASPVLDRTGDKVFLDLGWAGSIQKKLIDVMSIDNAKAHGLYLALNNHAFQSLERTNAAGFLINGFENGEVEDYILRFVEIMEQVCTPDIGTTIGYSDGLSLHAFNATPRDQKTQIAAVQAGIMDFVSRAAKHLPVVDVASLREACFRIYSRFTFKPTTAEKTLFRNWTHDDSIIETHDVLTPESYELIAPYMSLQQVLDGNFLYYYWPQGSETYGAVDGSLLDIFAFGVNQVRKQTASAAFASLALVNAVTGASTGTAYLNSAGRYFGYIPVQDKLPEFVLSFSNVSGTLYVDFCGIYINSNGRRWIKKVPANQMVLIDKNFMTQLRHAEGQPLAGTSLDRTALKVDVPQLEACVIEGICICGSGVRTIDSRDPTPDPRIHIDLFAGQRNLGDDVLSDGLPIFGLLDIQGWCFDHASLRSADRIEICVQFLASSDAPNCSLYIAERLKRSDVAEQFKVSLDEDVGFRTRIPISELKDGQFMIFMRLTFGGAILCLPFLGGRPMEIRAGKIQMSRSATQ